MNTTGGVYAVVEDCHGEAHRNPFIDNCNVCAPKWGIILRCANCNERLRYNRQAKLIRRCAKCGTTHADVDYYERRAAQKTEQAK